MRTLLFIISYILFIPYLNAGTCDHEICLEDSWGDGWSGNSLDVYVNGVLIHDDITLASGGGPLCFSIPANIGDDIDVIYNATGTYTSENDFYLYNSSSVLVDQGDDANDIIDYIACPPPPSNDLCSGATSLPCGTTNLAGSTNNSTNVAHGSGCTMSNYGVWYTFTGDGNQTTISVDAASGYDHEISISSGSCGSLSNIACRDNAVSGGIESYTFTTTVGITYFVYIAHYSNSSSTTGDFTISRTCVIPPSNDDCSNATSLPCGTTNLAGSTNYTSNTTHGTGCSLANYGVWYTFTGDGQQTTISATTTSFDIEMAIVSGSCGSFTNISCEDGPGSSGTESYTFTTSLGVDYYVYIAYYLSGSSTTGNFTISRSCTAPPTCTADMTINNTTYSNTGLTTCGFGDDYTSSDACGGSYMGGDDIIIEWNPNTTECVDITLTNTSSYTGVFVTSNCPDFAGATCLASNTSSSGNPQIEDFNVVSGTTYYIIVSTYPSPQCTNFDLDITSCPPPPVNDECAGATSVSVNPDDNCTLTTSGTIDQATGSAEPNSCFGTDDDDVWYSFVATNTTHYIDLLNITGSVTDMYHVFYSGNCGTLTQEYCSDANASTASGLTIGNTYYIRVYTYTSTGGQNTNFDICVSSPQPPPTNDECSTPTVVTVNNDETCTFTTAGTIHGATGSSDGNTCWGTDDDDVWFSFVALNSTHYIELLNITGSATDMYHVLYSGTCGSLTQIYCSDANSSTASGLTVGATYYLRVYTYTSTGGQDTDFDVCVNSDPPPVTACSGSYYDTGGSGSPYSNNETYFKTYCSSVAGQCLQMTFTNFDTESCCDELTIYNGPDLSSPVIGTYAGSSLPNGGTITANSGCLTIYWDSDGSVTGDGWEFSLSCVTCPPPSCSDGIQNGTETGVDCGGTCGACPVCGNPTTNDWCSDPAVLTQGGSGWSSSTYNYYTSDDPGTSFCGSIENNSWYVFTAQSTTEVFNFTTVNNCSWNDGIQAEVFEVTTDANGCCTSLSSVSNCWNPGYMTTGTVTATGLTIGNEYYLMVDGYAGDYCEFTVSNWEATGILPVTLTEFSGYNMNKNNKLKWTTETEINNDYFIVQKSQNARSFNDIGIVDGNGNSSIKHSYEYIDREIDFETNYYRLKQIDFDGKYEYSNVIVINSSRDLEINIYPNPSKENLYIDLSNIKTETTYTILFSDIIGSVGKETIKIEKNKNTYVLNNFKNFKPGIYLIQILDENNNLIKTEKIIKQ